jgi:uncharacterized membrane protein YheB (UPF0754 family)
MASHLYREFALNVVLHSLAGGLTDTVAVWMLFNPHKPFLGVQGAIPKNKARLAASIGKVVGEKLLTPQDMLQELTHGGIRDAFNERVAVVIQSLLDTERGSLRRRCRRWPRPWQSASSSGQKAKKPDRR